MRAGATSETVCGWETLLLAAVFWRFFGGLASGLNVKRKKSHKSTSPRVALPDNKGPARNQVASGGCTNTKLNSCSQSTNHELSSSSGLNVVYKLILPSSNQLLVHLLHTSSKIEPCHLATSCFQYHSWVFLTRTGHRRWNTSHARRASLLFI